MKLGGTSMAGSREGEEAASQSKDVLPQEDRIVG